MTFEIKKSRNFNNSGAVYTAPVIARKLNGYKVMNAEGEIAFVCNSDINIIDISDEEKNMQIEW